MDCSGIETVNMLKPERMLLRPIATTIMSTGKIVCFSMLDSEGT